VEMDDGSCIAGSLLIGADGGNSKVRDHFNLIVNMGLSARGHCCHDKTENPTADGLAALYANRSSGAATAQ